MLETTSHTEDEHQQQHDTKDEGSGTMLFQFLKCLLMILPQSTCYRLLRDRLTSIARFRQSTTCSNNQFTTTPYHLHKKLNHSHLQQQQQQQCFTNETIQYVTKICEIRAMHCLATWNTIRQESLEVPTASNNDDETKEEEEVGSDRRRWLGYHSKQDEVDANKRFRDAKQQYKNNNNNNNSTSSGLDNTINNNNKYQDFDTMTTTTMTTITNNNNDNLELQQQGAVVEEFAGNRLTYPEEQLVVVVGETKIMDQPDRGWVDYWANSEQ